MKIPPIAAISAKGPLGLVQLPRLWSKVLLDAKGLLPEGYAPCGDGFDKVVLEGLGLQRDAVVDYLTSSLPTYPEFENWVLEQKGGKIEQQTIDTINGHILGYTSTLERRQAQLKAIGMDPELSTTEYHTLLMYDDWNDFHKALAGN